MENQLQELQAKLNDTTVAKDNEGNESNNAAEQDQSEDETSSSNDSYSSSSRSSSESSKVKEYFAGTYEVTDAVGDTYTIVLNSDESATFTNSRGGVRYGSWRDFPYDAPKLTFSYGETPVIFFSGGESGLDNAIIADGYIYSSNIEYRAKNPKKRLEIRKVK